MENSQDEPGWAAENRLAEALGFVCKQDQSRGYGWCTFIKGSVHVWHCRKGWANAEKKNGFFTGHQYFKTLEEALTLRRYINEGVSD